MRLAWVSLPSLLCNKSIKVSFCKYVALVKPKYYSTSMDFQKIKFITFDVTGTLLEFRKPPFVFYKEFGEKYGIVCNTEDLCIAFKKHWRELNVERPHYGNDWRDWWTEIVLRTFKSAQAQGTTDTNLRQLAAELIARFNTTECWQLKDGAEELMNELRSLKESSKNLESIGIISNSDPRLYQQLKDFKLHHFFNPVILSHEHQISKPAREIFGLALDAFNRSSCNGSIQPFEALHVGDNYDLDFVAAKQSGWNSCLISPKFDILNIPQDKRLVLPRENELFKDLDSFRKFITTRVK